MALNKFGFTLAEIKREHILETLACCHGNRTRAAKFLGISLRGLRMKLRDFDQNGSMVPPPTLARPNTAPAIRRSVWPHLHDARQADFRPTRR